jgi:hypothetical protein
MSKLGDILSNTNRPQLNAQVAQSQALNSLRNAQTDDAMGNARKLSDEHTAASGKQGALENLVRTLKSSGDPHDSMLGDMIMGGGGNADELMKATLGNQQLGNRATLGNPNAPVGDQFAAEQGIQGTMKTPYVAVPDSYTDVRTPQPPGEPALIGQTPHGLAQTAEAASLGNLHTAEMNDPAKFHPGMQQMAPEDMTTVIRLTAQGLMPLPTAYMFTRNPAQAGAIVRGAEALNPNISSQMQPQIAATMKDFSGGGKNGQSLQGYRTVDAHLGMLDQANTALGNGDVQGLNVIGNTVSKWFGSPAPTNAQLIPQFVATETMRALARNAIGTGEDRTNIQKSIDGMALSPGQGVGVLNQMRGLLQGGKDSLRASYDSGTLGHGGQPGVPSFDDIYSGKGSVAPQPPPVPGALPAGTQPTPTAPPPPVAFSPTAPPVPLGTAGAVNPHDVGSPQLPPTPVNTVADNTPAGGGPAVAPPGPAPQPSAAPGPPHGPAGLAPVDAQGWHLTHDGTNTVYAEMTPDGQHYTGNTRPYNQPPPAQPPPVAQVAAPPAALP